MELVFYNGDFIYEKDISISINNRSFKYGDGFFETIKIVHSKVINFPAHFNRLQRSLDFLKLNSNYNYKFFEDKLSYLIRKNNVLHGISRIHISRKGEGKYLPDSNNIDICISTSHGKAYKYNSPISLCVYDDDYKALGSLSNLKSANSLIYILASIYARNNNFDNAILLNSSTCIVEATNANIFIVKNEKVYTPPLNDGCVSGIMRNWLFDQIDIIEESILIDKALEADEIFVSNTIDGLVPVKKIVNTDFLSFNITNFLQKKLINSSLGPLACLPK